MAKYEVTPELAYTIRSVRTQKKITAKSIAEHIHKSQSYMSRLEKGDIKIIDEDDLSSILLFIFKEEYSEPSLDTILDSIYSTLELQYSDSEIEQQLWFCNFDTVVRKIPIPRDMIEDISLRMVNLGISIADLCRRINANEGILPEVKNTDDYPFNEWQVLVNNHKIDFYFIKMQVSEQDISDILNGTATSANYVSLLAISYYLHKIEQYGSQILIPQDDNFRITNQAIDFLNQHHFYSISEKNKLSRQAKSQDERERLLSSFDRENRELVTSILTAIHVFSELDIQRNNRILRSINDNLDWDLGFMFALAGMSFRDLRHLSYSNKTKLLSDINELIQKYKEMPEQKKQIDYYNF